MYNGEEEKTRVGEPGQDITDAPKEASLVQIYGPNLGERYLLDRPEFTVGREATNDIVFDEDNVSRAHARFKKTGQGFEVADLGSTNGTLVNDADIRRSELRNGDIIKIGSVILKFITGGNAEALYHEEIYRMTINDGLTGVANRRFFDDFIEREIARSVRYGRPLSLAMIDIDHFKEVNDTHGHLAGDYVLRHMAAQLERTIRREELLARYGGEEFAIVMPETTTDKAVGFAEKVRDLVEACEFEFDGNAIAITVSIGIATLSSMICTQRDLVGVADRALYSAKHSGRNRVVIGSKRPTGS